DELGVLAIPAVDLRRLVLDLEREITEAAVLRQHRFARRIGRTWRGDRADDLSGGDAVMFIEEDVGILGPILVGREGDEQPGRRGLLRDERGQGSENGGQSA